ncbi:universal stress protein [Massilia sp. UMI-21]|nr:universal stress protein [Massilia sp. UMI-21]
MQTFDRILFVSRGLTQDVDALQQALSLARLYHADLHALLACPDFPDDLAKYKDGYTRWLSQQLEGAIQVARERSGVGEQEVPVPVAVECGDAPAVRIIRQVLRNAHDLVVKEAEKKEDGKGFAAVDMELLRKCPCPVWLGRPLGKPWSEAKVGVAIDPQSPEPEGQALSLRLLQLARSLADTCKAELTVISCWDYPAEEYLRGSPWVNIPEEELLEAVLGVQHRHRRALDRAIRKSGIGASIQVQHVRGRPEQRIPQLTKERNIDLLVMGSLGRTGIPGFVIGNTAENVVQGLACSLLALKPDGFISPVKAC